MPVKIPVVQTGLEASIEAAAKKAGRNLKINMGGNAKSIEGLSQPLGRITGKADQFTKSMEAANARVLAFGASVGVLSSVTRGFQDLIRVTIDVEKSLTSINSILNVTAKELDSFKSTIFSVAKNTEQSFSVVAQAALELSRQGLKAEEVTKRLNDSLVLSRLSGLGASEAVAGLTAAINSFNKSGITSTEVLNKLSAAAVSAAVSERDLIEGIKRSGSVATQAGVSFDELVGVITAVQAKTARGGAVIGNSFKTIFTRIQAIDKLQTMQNLGVEVTDASGQVLSATKLIQNLAKSLEEVPDARRLQIAEGLVGKFQVAPFLAILDDYISKTSQAITITEVSQNASREAYDRNEAQNATLSAAINRTTQSVAQLAEALGKIGVTDNLKSMLGFFNTVVDEIQEILDGDGLGSKFAKGIIAGIGNIITGPAFAVFAAIIGKLVIDLVRFGAGSLKTFFGLNKAAKEQATLQGQIASTLLGNSNIQKKILDIENSTLSVEQKRAAQTAFFTTALNEQVGIMTRMQGIAAKITPGVMAGTRGKGRAAGGFIPNYNAIVGYGSERADISKGVGGAPASARPVTIPNFNFGGGQKGTMVANSSEYIVPNYAGGDGSAIFNQDMAASIGLPPRARKIGAAGGYIPNFVNEAESLVMFAGDRGADEKKVFHVGKDKAKRTKAYASKPKGMLTTPVTVPIYRLKAGKGDAEPQDIKAIRDKLSKSSTNTAKNFAKKLSGKTNLPNVTEKKIESLFNPGAFEGMSGSIFEVALGSILASKQFLDYSSRTSNSRIDLPYDNKLFSKFGARGKGRRGSEVKATGSLASGAAEKFYDILVGLQQVAGYKGNTFLGKMMKKSRFDQLYPQGIGPRGLKYKAVQTALGGTVTRGGINNLRSSFAGGYIPNFAGGLQESIARESAAGLPINQIRINQDPKLRNSGNPMGLAVTNTRDEPTGAIPNFAKKASPDQASDAMGGMVGKMLAVQIGFSALSGVLGSVAGESKALSTGLMLLNAAVSAALVAQTFGGIGKSAKGIASFATGNLGIGIGKSGIRDMTAAQGLGGMSVKGNRGNTLRAGGKMLGGGALALGGPLIAASAAAVGIGTAFNSLTGRTQAAAKAQEKVAEAAGKAASVLNSLQAEEADKDKFEINREGVGEEMASKFLNRVLTTGVGSESKEFNTLSSSIDTALKRGASEEDIQKKLDEFRQEQKEGRGFGTKVMDDFLGVKIGGKGEDFINFGTLTVESKDLANFSREMRIFGEADLGKRFKEITGGLTEEQRKGLISGDEKTIQEVANKTGQGGETKLSEAAIKLLGADLKATEAQRDKTKEKEKQKAIDQINTSLAQEELKTQINLIKLKAEAISKDQIALKRNEFLNNLSEVQKQKIEQRIALKGIENETDGKIAEQITKQIDGMEKLTLDSEKQTELKEKLSGLSLEQLGSERKVKEILGDIFGLDGKITGEQDALLKGINKVTSGLKAEEALRKSNLKLSTDIGIADAGRAQALRTAIRGAERGNRESTGAAEFELGGKLLEIQVERGKLNPNLTPQARANAEKGFVAREGLINIEGAENKAVDETKQSILDLSKEIKNTNLQKQFQGLLEELEKFGPDALKGVRETLSTIAEEAFISGEKSGRIPRPNSVFITEDQQSDLKDASGLVKQKERNIEATKRQAGANNDLADAQAKVADGFKSYTVLLRNFTIGLSQQAEQLKLDFLTIKDGASAISNIDQQLFTAASKVGGAGATARASDTQALRGATDRITLARTSVERRAAIKNKDILSQELALKTEIAVKQEDGITKEKELVGLREKLIELEKQRLAIGTSRAELLENEFVFTQEEIQEGLDRALVQNARTFVDTISDGLVDAIAKGQDLGDVLKQAASNFFLGEAKSNMSAAFKNITGNLFASGGPVTGGSGSKDDVPALLMGGEFVMKKSAVQKYGSGFMNSLNSGTIPAMARGGLFTPGTYGQGAMKGSRNLLDFATQSFTTGAFDRFGSGSGFASIGLEPQSAALTMFGRRKSPAFQREQASKQKAFDLFTRQMEKEKEARERGSGFSEILKNSLLSFGASFGFKKLTDVFGPKVDISKASEGLDIKKIRSADERRLATGGYVPNAAGIDTVPSMLSGGEFVMNAAATQKIGRGNLNALNSGAGGGSGDVVGKLDELISVSENSGETVINITVNSDGSSNSQGNGDDQQNSLATKIKDVVKQVIDDEKRLGGSLRQARA